MRSLKLLCAALAVVALTSAACGRASPDAATSATADPPTTTARTADPPTTTAPTADPPTTTAPATVDQTAGDQTTRPPPPPGPTTVFGDRLAEYDDAPGSLDLAVGVDAPIVTGTDMLTGEGLTSDTGSPILLGFYAHWCPHCQSEVPEIVAWLDDNELPDGVDFLAISTFVDQARGNHPPDAWLRRERWPLAVLSDDRNEVAWMFGIQSVPFTMAVTADGKILGRVGGNIGPEGLVQLAQALLDEEAETKVAGASLEEFERSSSGTRDGAVGADAPVITGTDLLTGEALTSDTGSPTLVVFYSHWCPHCQRDVSDISAWLERNQLPAGVEVLGISTFENPTRDNYPPDDWLRDKGWPLPVMADTRGAAAEAFGISSVPFTVAITAEGKVAGRVNGEIGAAGFASLATQLAAGPLVAGQAVDAEGGGSSSR